MSNNHKCLILISRLYVNSWLHSQTLYGIHNNNNNDDGL